MIQDCREISHRSPLRNILYWKTNCKSEINGWNENLERARKQKFAIKDARRKRNEDYC